MPLPRRLVPPGLLALLLVCASAGSAEAAVIADVSNLSIPGSPVREQTGRLVRDGTPSSCSGTPAKLEPRLQANDAQLYRYRNPTLANHMGQPTCVTITINASTCGNSKPLFSVAYIGAFDPANPLTSYAADMGSSTSTTASYSFTVPARANFGVVIHEAVKDGLDCPNFSYRADSLGPWAANAPQIGGNAAVGSVLTGSDTTWRNPQPASVARRWVRCDTTGNGCTPIPGATAPTYTVTNADLGATLRLRNEATDAQGTNFADSGVVEPFIPFLERDAESLGAGDRVHNGFFVRSALETRCGAPNAAPAILQPASSFLYDTYPVASLLNEPACLVVRTVPTCSGGVTPSIYNPAFDPAAGIVANYAGNSSRDPSFAGVVSVPLPPGERREAVVSKGFNGGVCESYAVTLGADAPFATERPAVAGTPAEGRPLTATNGTWSGTPALTHSWLRCDAAGANCTPIEGATVPTYSPAAADAGRRLRVRVTATQGRSVSSDSEPSAPVAPAPRRDDTVPPPLDRTAPRGTVRLGSRNLARAVKTGRVPIAITCDEPCAAAVRLRVTKKLAKRLRLRRKVVIASGRGLAPAARRTTLRVKLTRRARRALRTRRSLKLRMTGTFTDASGNAASASRRASLKRRR